MRAFHESTESIIVNDFAGGEESPNAEEVIEETSESRSWPLFNGQLEESFDEENSDEKNDEISEFEEMEEAHAAAFGRKLRVLVDV